MNNIVLCLVNAVLMSIGQIIFKYGMKGKTIDSITSAVGVLFTPIVFTGIILYGCSTVLWLYILSKVPISYAYPIQALAYPLVMILAFVLFKEVIPASRWLGIALIILGVLIATRR